MCSVQQVVKLLGVVFVFFNGLAQLVAVDLAEPVETKNRVSNKCLNAF